jgi:hypothetical protein
MNTPSPESMAGVMSRIKRCCDFAHSSADETHSPFMHQDLSFKKASDIFQNFSIC